MSRTNEQWDAFAAWLRREHGACHGLVNNAGITMRSRLGEVSLEDWNRTLAINVTGPMLGMQTLMDLMPRRVLDRQHRFDRGAERTLRDSLHREQVGAPRPLARGEPGARPARHSRERRDAGPDRHGDDLRCSADGGRRADRQRSARPGRHGHEDVAATVQFLLSEDSSYLSGLEIPVDGGQTAHGGMKLLSDAVRSRGVQPLREPPIGRSVLPVDFLAVGRRKGDSVAFDQMLRVGRHCLPFV